MLERKDGLIINVNSIAGKRANPLGGAAYAAAKFGLRGLMTAIAAEEKGSGVRFSSIFPGEVNTPILDADQPRWTRSNGKPCSSPRTWPPQCCSWRRYRPVSAFRKSSSRRRFMLMYKWPPKVTFVYDSRNLISNCPAS